MNETTLVDLYKIKLKEIKTNISSAKRIVEECAGKIEKEFALTSNDNLPNFVSDRDAIEKRKFLILKELDNLIDIIEGKIAAET